MQNLNDLIRSGFENLKIGIKSDDSTFFNIAVNLFLEAKALYPTSPRPILGLGASMSSMNKHSQAIDFYSQLIDQNPPIEKSTLYKSFSGRGYSNHILGKNKKSISDYTEALKINKNSFAAHQGIGLVKTDTGQYLGAIEHFEKAIELSNGSSVNHIRERIINAEKLLNQYLKKLGGNDLDVDFKFKQLN